MTDSAPTPRDPHSARTPSFRDRPAIRDAFYALVFMFPAAGLVALLYRFPVPFGGYARGPAGVWDAMLATIFYGLVGGFLLVPLLAGLLSVLIRRGDRRPAPRTAGLVAPAAALLYAILVALL